MRLLSIICLATVLYMAQAETVCATSPFIVSAAAEHSMSVSQNDRHLLPERPKNFNPMQPPSMPDMQNLDAQQQFAESSSALGMYMSELSHHLAQLSLSVRSLVLAMTAGVFFLGLALLYQRRSAIALERAVRVAVARADLAEQNIAALKEAAQTQLRAYVLVEGAKGEWMDDKSGRYKVQVQVKNFGVTPAYHLTGWFTVFVDDVAVSAEAPLLPHTSEMAERILPPKAICLQYASTPQSIAHELKAVGSGARAIYIHVEIRYKDGFATERYARFRGMCSGELNLSAGNFEPCSGDAD